MVNLYQHFGGSAFSIYRVEEKALRGEIAGEIRREQGRNKLNANL
jgi:hypothetical protein